MTKWKHQRAYDKKERARRLVAGLCTAHGCHERAEPGNSVCDYHLVVQRKRSERNRRQNPEKRMLAEAKSFAKERGLSFNLDLSDIVIPEFCPVLGIKLNHGEGVGGAVDSSPSLDRFIPGLGYVKGNVCVISWRANRLKCNASLAEVEKLVIWMRGHQQ